MLIRLDKFISDSGLCTRSDARELIRSGRVRVSGLPVTAPETKLDPDTALVTLDGRTLGWRQHRCFMMDKPAGLLTATEDGRGETVLDLLPPELRRLGLFPVGRLDKDTTGLLILTNDGELAHRVISPKSGIEKLYLAQTDGTPPAEAVEEFKKGLVLRDGTRCLPAGLEIVSEGLCRVSVTEGKYHQVKRMLAAAGAPVISLRRLKIGNLHIDDTLGPGGVRELGRDEIDCIFDKGGME